VDKQLSLQQHILSPALQQGFFIFISVFLFGSIENVGRLKTRLSFPPHQTNVTPTGIKTGSDSEMILWSGEVSATPFYSTLLHKMTSVDRTVNEFTALPLNKASQEFLYP
jgi:hypothetical protein